MPRVHGLDFRRRGTANRRQHFRYQETTNVGCWPDNNQEQKGLHHSLQQQQQQETTTTTSTTTTVDKEKEKGTIGVEQHVKTNGIRTVVPKSSFRSRRKKRQRNRHVQSTKHCVDDDNTKHREDSSHDVVTVAVVGESHQQQQQQKHHHHHHQQQQQGEELMDLGDWSIKGAARSELTIHVSSAIVSPESLANNEKDDHQPPPSQDNDSCASFSSSSNHDKSTESVALSPRTTIRGSSPPPPPPPPPLPLRSSPSGSVASAKVLEVTHSPSLYRVITREQRRSPTIPPHLESLELLLERQRLVSTETYFEESLLEPKMTLPLVYRPQPTTTTTTTAVTGRLGNNAQWVQADSTTLLLQRQEGQPQEQNNRETTEQAHFLQNGTPNLTTTEAGKLLLWEATLLEWVQCKTGDLSVVPTPMDLIVSPNDKDSLCLVALRQQLPEAMDVVGTMETVLELHCVYHLGPIPEPAIAWLLQRVVDAVGMLHKCGVVHNRLGLDSFLVAKCRNSSNNGNGWRLILQGLGQAEVLMDTSNDNDTNNKNKWIYTHDLYSVANMAWLLLTGGAPFSWKKVENRHEPNHEALLSKNQYLRGKLGWTELMAALMNPPSARANLDTKWPILSESLELISMVRSMSDSDHNQGVPTSVEGFLDSILSHAQQSSDRRTLPRLLDCTKLSSDPPHLGCSTREEDDTKTSLSMEQQQQQPLNEAHAGLSSRLEKSEVARMDLEKEVARLREIVDTVTRERDSAIQQTRKEQNLRSKQQQQESEHKAIIQKLRAELKSATGKHDKLTRSQKRLAQENRGLREEAARCRGLECEVHAARQELETWRLQSHGLLLLQKELAQKSLHLSSQQVHTTVQLSANRLRTNGLAAREQNLLLRERAVQLRQEHLSQQAMQLERRQRHVETTTQATVWQQQQQPKRESSRAALDKSLSSLSTTTTKKSSPRKRRSKKDKHGVVVKSKSKACYKHKKRSPAKAWSPRKIRSPLVDRTDVRNESSDSNSLEDKGIVPKSTVGFPKKRPSTAAQKARTRKSCPVNARNDSIDSSSSNSSTPCIVVDDPYSDDSDADDRPVTKANPS